MPIRFMLEPLRVRFETFDKVGAAYPGQCSHERLAPSELTTIWSKEHPSAFVVLIVVDIGPHAAREASLPVIREATIAWKPVGKNASMTCLESRMTRACTALTLPTYSGIPETSARKFLHDVPACRFSNRYLISALFEDEAVLRSFIINAHQVQIVVGIRAVVALHANSCTSRGSH